MIIKATQRGGAKQLARHLLNANDNEHVKVHEVSGFLSGNVPGALHEAYVASKETRCKQFMFSVSLSPPPGQPVNIDVFEDAAKRIEERMGLTGQPRVFVFHEKEARRHAHIVYSRIDAEQMKAINLPYFKNQIMEISKELYLEHGWKLPEGFIDRENRNPLNFTIKEWQQAKFRGDDPRARKTTLQECWSISKDKEHFIRAMEQKGYYLAQGDRRGFVAVDWRGEVYSLPRDLALKSGEVKARLGDENQLPTVADTKGSIDKQLAERMQHLLDDLKAKHQKRARPLVLDRMNMRQRHKDERERLEKIQAERWKQELQARRAEYRTGLPGLWDLFSGQRDKLRKQHDIAAYEAIKRDRTERDQLALTQISERALLQNSVNSLKNDYQKEKVALQEAVFGKVSKEQEKALQAVFQSKSMKPAHEYGPSM